METVTSVLKNMFIRLNANLIPIGRRLKQIKYIPFAYSSAGILVGYLQL